MKKRLHRLLSVLLAVALVASFAISAYAEDITPSQEQTKTYTYTAPTAPMAVDSSIITASAHRAASPILGIMGVNAVSGFGMINGSAPTDLVKAQSSAALGVWGSSINDSPDPYYWNYFYNFYAAENGLALSEDALVNPSRSASPVAADTTVSDETGGVSVSLYARPDILVGCASTNSGSDTNGYDEQLAYIHSLTAKDENYQEGDESYDPQLVSYQTTYIKQMIESVYRLADAIEAVEAKTGKTTRYGNVQTIASDYEKYVYGIISYVEEELAAKGLPEKTVAVLTSINEDGTYGLADSLSTSATSLVRAYEYSMPVSSSLTDAYGLTVTKEQLLSADVIITINNQNITQDALIASLGGSGYDGIIISNTPSALYGVTMNSVENAMGYAYVIGCMYCDILDIDPVELCAYFYEHFYHISDLEGVATVVKTNFADCILPANCSTTLSSTYSAAAVEEKLIKGMNYYAANKASFQNEEYALNGLSDWEIDWTQGIGKGQQSSQPTAAFSDVGNDYYTDAVAWAVENGITNGVGDGRFGVGTICSRAMVVTFLYRAAGEPAVTGKTQFTDVPADAYYADAVAWAVENGITTGTTETTFEPDGSCTRGMVVTFLHRAAGKPESSASNVFTDVESSQYYSSAVAWAVENHITTGTTATTFEPNSPCKREQVVTFLYRAA